MATDGLPVAAPVLVIAPARVATAVGSRIRLGRRITSRSAAASQGAAIDSGATASRSMGWGTVRLDGEAGPHCGTDPHQPSSAAWLIELLLPNPEP